MCCLWQTSLKIGLIFSVLTVRKRISCARFTKYGFAHDDWFKSRYGNVAEGEPEQISARHHGILQCGIFVYLSRWS